MSARFALAIVAFLGAIVSYGVGLVGKSGSWLVAMVGSLFLLTLGFYLAGSRERSGEASGSHPTRDTRDPPRPRS